VTFRGHSVADVVLRVSLLINSLVADGDGGVVAWGYWPWSPGHGGREEVASAAHEGCAAVLRSLLAVAASSSAHTSARLLYDDET
jgi:hypothetical protein